MKILVLSSGGLDSTVLLHKAVQEVGPANVIALSVYYGQKHAIERESALWQCEHLGVQMIEADLSPVFKYNLSASALLQGSKTSIVHKSYAEQLEDLGGKGTVSAYVPYRNGLFLSYAAAVAIQLDCDILYYGAHADDAAGRAYPDCTPSFISAQATAIVEGTGGRVTMEAPWWAMNKASIVTFGLSIGMSHEEFGHTWSCYEGLEKPCGTCGTCIDRKVAFEINGITDIM
ncbi:MAG: 7-cyano-7-deazaguanine synthase [Tannerellaceae bacterium]